MGDQLYYWKINCIIGRSTVLMEDQLYHLKINCIIERLTVLLEDKLHYWKIYCIIGRSTVLKSPAFDARTLGMSNLIILYSLQNIWLLLLIS